MKLKTRDFRNMLSYLNIFYIIVVITTSFKLVWFNYQIGLENANGKLVHFDFSRILVFMFVSCAFYSISLVYSKKKSLIIILGLNIFLSFLMFANIVYYRGFGSLISIFIIDQYKNIGAVESSVSELIFTRDALFFIDSLIFIIIYPALKKIALKQKEFTYKMRLSLSIIPIYFMSIGLNFDNFYESNPNVAQLSDNYSMIGFHYFDFSEYVSNRRAILSKKSIDDATLDSFMAEKNKLDNVANIKDEGIFKDKNVIFLQIESLENFVIDLEVDGQEITPNLNKMLNNSYYFNNVITQTDLGNSSDADFLANTSYLPIYSGSISYRFGENGFNSMANILRNSDYKSHAIHSGKPYFWNKEVYLQSLGFDTVTDIDGMDKTNMFFLGLADEEHLKQVAKKISKIKDDKFYLYTVTETSHTPFDIPKEMQYLDFDDEYNKSLFGKYFQSIRYTDEAIGLFVKDLEKQGILDDTILVIYGDHEGIHKYNNATKLNKANSDSELYENNEEVPFIIYNPNIENRTEIDKIGGQVDIMPTVLSLLGIDKTDYEETIIGKNLLNDAPGYALKNNGELYTNYDFDDNMLSVLSSTRKVGEQIIFSDYFKKYYKKPKTFYYNGQKVE